MDAKGRVSQAEHHATLDRRDEREAKYRARVAELESAIRALKREHETPVPDLALRAMYRVMLFSLVSE